MVSTIGPNASSMIETNKKQKEESDEYEGGNSARGSARGKKKAPKIEEPESSPEKSASEASPQKVSAA